MRQLRFFLLSSVIVIMLGCSNVADDDQHVTEGHGTMESKLVEVKLIFDGPLGTNWQEASTELKNPDVEIYFLLQDGSTFHDVHTAQFKYPEITRKFEDQVSTAEVVGHEQELVDYYNQIAAAARLHKIEFTEISHLFWIRLRIHDGTGKQQYSFSYYDSLDEIIKFQEWVNKKNEQDIFTDQDQGWALEAQHREGFVYLIQYDPDYDSYSVNSFISHDLLNSEMMLSVERARNIIKTLSESLGTDVWTRYRGYQWDKVEL